MVRKIADLRAASDEELIAEHDARAQHTVIGTRYYLDELNRRAAERSAESMGKLTHRTYVLTWVNAAVAVVAAFAAIVALVA
jgi:hypothetical protein